MQDDVNTVCFADESNQVYLSGSDDCMIKVWDRRCGEDGVNRAQGVLPGHTEGLAYMSPKVSIVLPLFTISGPGLVIAQG